jgi:hypothetical protein
MGKVFDFRTSEGGCLAIIDYPSLRVAPADLQKHNIMLTKRKKIKILFDYPLHRPATLTFANSKGFTYRKFFSCVYAGYQKIYKEEGLDPGHIPGMWNRMPSNGKYGIWGHDLSDLVLTGCREVKPGVFELHIDS